MRTASRPAPREDRQLSTPALEVAAVGLASAVVAVLVSRLLLPFLSIDNDEVIYRYQAQALAKGHLLPPAPLPPSSFTPWLAAVVDHHYVMKYTPVTPALLALSLRVTGGYAPILALTAAAAVGMTYLLAVEVLADRRAAAVAAAMLAASPMVIVQSGTLLAYLPSLVILEAFAWSLIKGVRTDGPRLMAPAGLAIGLAIAVRPFDAVLFAVPLVIWAAIRLRRQGGSVITHACWLAGGALLPVAGLLAYDAMATGSAFRLPFGLLEPKDAIGFGVRKLFPSDVPHHFQVTDGLRAVGTHLWLMGGWAFGGIVAAVLTVWALTRRHLEGPGAALLASGLLVSVGYVAFWGSWNAAKLWGGTRYVGPFYLLPLLIPLTIGGAAGLVQLFRRSSAAGAAAVIASVALSGFVLWWAVQDNATFTRQDRSVTHMLGSQGARPLFFVAADPPFLMHPSSLLGNGPSLGRGPIYAVANGNADLTVLADHQGHQPYLVHIAGNYQYTPMTHWSVWVQRLQPRQAAALQLSLRFVRPGHRDRLRLIVTWAGQRRAYEIGPADEGRADLLVTTTGAALAGRLPIQVDGVQPGGPVQLELDVLRPNGQSTRIDRQALPAVISGGQVDALLPVAMTGKAGTGLTPPLEITAGDAAR